MPKALPLHHPTAEELHAAHAVYVEKEARGYAYRLAQHLLADAGFSDGEAVHTLLSIWNSRSSYTRSSTPSTIEALLVETADARSAFDDRPITSLVDAERGAVASIYVAFRTHLGPVGAAKALSVLQPRFFPLWDSDIAYAYLGYKWRKSGATADCYLTFIDYVIEQCAAVDEAQFGAVLLKTLDEWNYVIWTKGWIDPPA